MSQIERVRAHINLCHTSPALFAAIGDGVLVFNPIF